MDVYRFALLKELTTLFLQHLLRYLNPTLQERIVARGGLEFNDSSKIYARVNLYSNLTYSFGMLSGVDDDHDTSESGTWSISEVDSSASEGGKRYILNMVQLTYKRDDVVMDPADAGKTFPWELVLESSGRLWLWRSFCSDELVAPPPSADQT